MKSVHTDVFGVLFFCLSVPELVWVGGGTFVSEAWIGNKCEYEFKGHHILLPLEKELSGFIWANMERM